MNTFKKYRFAYMVLAAALLLSACLPNLSADTDGATIDATQAAALIETAVAKALNAQATQNAEAVPQASPTLNVTKTPIPAPATLTPLPTITPLVLAASATPTNVSGGGGSYTPEYACTLTTLEPSGADAILNRNGTFDVNITIKNTGTATWPAGYDLIHYSGTNLAPDFTTLELPEVEPGDSYSFGPYDGIAPDKGGRYVMTFKLQGVDCWPYVAIEVK